MSRGLVFNAPGTSGITGSYYVDYNLNSNSRNMVLRGSGENGVEAMENTSFITGNQLTLPSEEVAEETGSSFISSEVGETAGVEIGAGLEAPSLLGIGAAQIVSSFVGGRTVTEDKLGEGVAGNTFGQNFQTAVDQQHSENVTLENMALVGAGSLFGPEGTAVGLVAAGANLLINQPDEATIQSNLGTQVPVSNLN